MSDALIVLAVLLVMGLIVVALLRIAPRHEKEVNNAFEELAMRHGLRYQAEDDGRVREFVSAFDGIGRLDAPSSGEPKPQDVVSGVLDGQRIFVFRLGLRDPDGSAHEWFVAGLQLKKPIADRCSVQFCLPGADTETSYLADPIVNQQQTDSFDAVVRARDAAGAGRLMEEQVLGQLATHAEQFPFRPELQVRQDRIIAYPADRDTAIDHANDLDLLMGLTKRAASIAR